MKVLANDGISNSGIKALEKGGFEVITTKVAQEQVASFLNTHSIDVLLVRSATKVRQDIIDNCPSLKIIGRGGVGMDNIDVDYARSKGVHVINTPAASSESVAELVFAHLFSGVRFLHDANRTMPLEGDTNFNGLKPKLESGFFRSRVLRDQDMPPSGPLPQKTLDELNCWLEKGFPEN